MSLLGFLILLVVAGVCGAIGQALAGSSRGGFLVSIAVGFIGALLGMFAANELGLHEPIPVEIDSKTFPVIWSIAGSALFVAILSLIRRAGPKR